MLNAERGLVGQNNAGLADELLHARDERLAQTGRAVEQIGERRACNRVPKPQQLFGLAVER